MLTTSFRCWPSQCCPLTLLDCSWRSWLHSPGLLTLESGQSPGLVPNHFCPSDTMAHLLLFFFFNFYLFILTVLGFHCCVGYPLVAMCRLLIAVASLTVDMGTGRTGFSSCRHMGLVFVAPMLWSLGSVVVVHRLSCSEACEIFPDQGSNPCLLHWQMDSFFFF